MFRSNWQQCCNGEIHAFRTCDEIEEDGSSQGRVPITHIQNTTMPSHHSSNYYFNITTITTTTIPFNLTNHSRTIPTANLTCNGVTYDPTVLGCCEGALYDLSTEDCVPESMACGSESYNTTSQGCCRETVYDLYTSICCNGTLQERFSNETNCYNDTSYEVSYNDTAYEYPSNETTYEEPFNHTANEASNSTNDSNNSIHDMNVTFCGHFPYDPATHACCNNTQIVVRSDPLQSDTDICCSSDEVYDAITHTCQPHWTDVGDDDTNSENDDDQMPLTTTTTELSYDDDIQREETTTWSRH